MMNLTPEEREIGKANFHRALGNNLEVTRRDFLQAGLLTAMAAGGSVGAFYFGYESTIEKPLRVAVLGTGDEGQVLIGACNPEFIEIVAIADIRPYNIHRAFHGDWSSEAAMEARPGLMKVYGWKTEDEARKHVKVYGHYEDLLKAEKDNIEAVIIALPLHLHAPAAIAAMKLGKHVLTEKLMGHSVHECKEMARMAKQASVHLAVGHQRHYNILYENATDMIRRGLLGDLHYIRAQWHRGNLPGRDSWAMPLPPGAKPDDKSHLTLLAQQRQLKQALEEAKKSARPVTAEIERLEKMLAQVEAQIRDQEIIDKVKEYGYQDKTLVAGNQKYFRPAIEELIRWRLWERTGGGLMAELGSHQLDAASIFIAAMHGGQKQLPLNVAAAGNRPIFPLDREIEDHVYCIIEFPAPGYDPNDPVGKMKKIAVQYASINGNGFGGYGEIVFGTKGTLILEREQEAMLYAGSDTTASVGVSQGAGGAVLDTQASGPAQKRAEGLGQMATAKVSRGYREEIEHWAWCIRRNPNAADPEIHPRCYPKVALADAVLALTTNIAAREGRRIEFKPEWFDIDSDETPEGVKPDLSRYA